MTEKPDESSITANHSHSLGSNGVEEQPQLILSTLIASFEKRAEYRQLESYCIVVIMLTLLAVGAYVFWQAKDIAIADTSINTTARRQEIINQYNTDLKDMNDLRDKINAVKINLPFLSAINGILTKVWGSNQYCPVSLKTPQGDIKTAAALIDELKTTVAETPDHCKRGPSTGKEGARIALLLFDDNAYPMNIAYDVLTFDPTSMTALNSQANGEITTTPTGESLKKMADDMFSLNHKLGIEGAAQQRLEKMKNEAEINQLTGQKDETGPVDAKT